MKHTWLRTTLVLIALGSFSVQAQQATFTPERGFAGPSQGNGTLKLLFGMPRKYHVDSFGKLQRDAVFRLDQTVKFEDKPAQRRFWLIRETTPLHYEGTLTDASGSVTGRTIGAQLALRYRVKVVLVMHQTLRLSQDGKIIDNSGRITFLGIPVGSLHEIIKR